LHSSSTSSVKGGYYVLGSILYVCFLRLPIFHVHNLRENLLFFTVILVRPYGIAMPKGLCFTAVFFSLIFNS